jgi:hypothetical protein
MKYVIPFLLVCFAVVSCTNPAVTSEKYLKKQPPSGDNYIKERKEVTPLRTEKRNYAPGQILVKFADGTEEQTIATIQAKLSLTTIRIVHRPNLYLMRILDNSSVEAIMKRLRDFPEVVFSEPNYIASVP